MGDEVIYYFPSQIAMLLGKSRFDVLDWMDSGKLNFINRHGKPESTAEDIAQFLHVHPEEIGRVYCDDLIPFFNQARSDIVTVLENLNEVNNTWQGYRSNKSRNS